MIRLIGLLVVLTLTSACEQYREPRANCFSFVAPDPGLDGCTFSPLRGPNVMDGRP